MSDTDKQSRAAFLTLAHFNARREGRDPGFTGRLAESFGNSFVSPQMTSDLADLCGAAVAMLAEANGVSFEQQLRQLDRPGVVRASDVDTWLAPAA